MAEAISPGTGASRLRQFQAALQIQPGEGARVAVMILYSAAAIGGILTVGEAVAATLFLSQLPASATPFLFILPALAVVPALLLYNRAAARFRLDRVIIGSNALLLSGLVLFRFTLAMPFGRSFAVLAALYLFTEVSYTLAILQFWSLAGQVFNPREAKRLFGLIAVGGTCANIVAGLTLGTLARLIGVENLLWIVAAAFGVCMGCSWTLRPRPGETASASAPAAGPGEKPRSNFLQDLRAIRHSPLLLAIGCLTVLVSLLINIGAYEFCLSLQANFTGRPADLAAYLGAFYFIGGLAGFVMQSYLTGRVMNRFGVIAALAFFPLGMALGAAFSLLTGGGLWAMTILRIVDPIFRRTINSATLNVLYLPAPAGLRERAKEVFEGLYAAAFGAAGVIFLLLQNVPAWNFLYYSVPLLFLAAAWLALLPWARRQYTRALADSLKRRVLDLEGATIDVSDETTVQVLMAALGHTDELLVLHALQLIASAPAVNWAPRLASLLTHPSAAVRLQALRYLGQSGRQVYAENVAPLLADPEPEVRAAAIEAYYALVEGPAAASRVAPLSLDAHSQVRGAVVLGLLRHGDQAGRLALQEMLKSGDPTLRQAGARVIGLTPTAELHAWLIPLFDDADLGVRLSAIRAAQGLNSRDLLPPLLRLLSDQRTAAAAADALAAYTIHIEPELGAALEDPRLREYIPPILQRLRTRQAAEVLLAHFHSPDDELRGKIFEALARLQAEGVEVNLATARLREALIGELRRSYQWIIVREDLREEGLDALLADALQARLGRALDRAFFLLNLLAPAHTRQVQRVRQILETAPGSQRALAVELLDTLGVADRQVKELLLPLIEAPVERLLEIARAHFGLERRSMPDRLRELAQGPDDWLRICAIHRIGVLQRAELSENVLATLDTDDALLRETALAAARSFLDPQRYAEALQAHAADHRFPVVQRYAQAQLQITNYG